ncbi:unnamed protein product [Acanthocheilonema viteae]|uniref:DUF1758 domain-containing protein n=1 Tax=Acanthocheilonema viteae TaxID=6277 RepID=A0A498SNS7_ACAVI|nr:unnamed protein product [Acanthocheilonema viteae]
MNKRKKKRNRGQLPKTNMSEEITVTKRERTIALFDSGARLSCISKKLANRLKLVEIESERMTVARFGDRNPKSLNVAKVQLEIKTVEGDITVLVLAVINYPTSSLQIVTVNEQEIPHI